MTGMNATQQSPHSSNRLEDYEIDLKMVINLIKHSYKLVAIVTLIFFISGIYYAETRPPAYLSTAMIEVGNGGMSALAAGGGVGGLASLISSQTSSADIEVVLLKSPFVLAKVVREMGMDISVSPKDPGFIARHFGLFQPQTGIAKISLLSVPNVLLAKPLTLIVQENNQYELLTKNGKKIVEGRVGQLASASYLSQPFQIQVDALKAKPGEAFTLVKQPIPDVVDGVASGLGVTEEGDGTGILKLSYASGNPVQAQQLLNGVLTAAKEKNLKEKSQEAEKTLHFISQQLPESKNNLKASEEKLDKYSVKSGVFDPKTAGIMLSSSIDKLQQTLENLKFKKMVLLQNFTSLHPLVIAITQKENEIISQINVKKGELQKLPKVGAAETTLLSDAKIQAGIYTGLTENVEKMEMIKASNVSSVRILNSATYPVSRIPVKKIKIVFAAVVLGFMSSLTLIFIRHVLSPVIEDPDAVERALGIVVSAIIPYSQQQLTYNKKAAQDKLYAKNKSFLLALENPHEISIEGVRSLRTTIQMALLDAKNNIIAITGCSPGVGKSFISSNLAVLMSQLDKKVLIIDSDIRLGKLSQCFGKLKAPGLSTFLQNEAGLESIIQNVMPGKLDFIATGLYPENPSELLSQKALGDLIQTLKSRYDIVIIDTPPILAVTDPALILQHSAINLMVLGVGKDQLKEVKHAKNMLEKGGVKLSGLIFNHVKQQKAGFGYNYGYANYHYHYGQNK
ncbi:MAG: polysaccharide biosynthesis tyrosine autokinase [Gammaproteobacteria bacterium]|nr:polysaccharide biosynthesis tyrosine autokinase [Gammaproteobacteria bacterium]